jgi:hypothetical protein
MGKGEVDRALTLANRDLASAGITDPTPQQTEAALMGGTVTNAQGQSTELAGVLQLRNQGMGWGRIAHTIGVHPAQSEQGAVRSMRDSDHSQIAGISASHWNALNRDNTPAIGAAATSVSAHSDSLGDGQRGSFSSAPTRDQQRTSASAVNPASGKAGLGGRDNGSSAMGAATSQASVRDRDSSVSALGRGGDSHAGGNHGLRGKERSSEVRAAGAAVAGARIADRGGKERGVTTAVSAGGEGSLGKGSRGGETRGPKGK